MDAQAAAVVEQVPETDEILLIDLSSIAHPIWHISGQEPDQDWVSRQIVAKVRDLAAKYPKAAVCCDKGRSFRKQLSPDYKANRPQQEAALYHQIDVAIERLKADGFPVWAVDGYEADDLIASAATAAIGIDGVSVLIVSSDKDLLQLVGPKLRVMSARDSAIYDEAAVVQKFGVKPSQIRDYLSLVGDPADNIKGAAGIGQKKAADLLSRYGSLSEIYFNLDNHGTQFKPAMATALREFAPRLPEVQSLIQLRTDVEIPFAELDNERTPKDLPSMEGLMSDVETVDPPPPAVVVEEPKPAPAPDVPKPESKGNGNGKSTALAIPEVPGVVVEFEKQLEPRNLPQAATLANHLFASRMFAAYGTPQAVLSTILAGRELGLQAMASLRAFHIVEGKHQLSADLMRALVLRSGLAEYFRCKVRTAERCVFVTHRKGDPEPIELEYTIAEAQAAGLVKSKSGWEKNPADMLVARASSKLARLVYPEIVHGLYSPEEFD